MPTIIVQSRNMRNILLPSIPLIQGEDTDSICAFLIIFPKIFVTSLPNCDYSCVLYFICDQSLLHF